MPSVSATQTATGTIDPVPMGVQDKSPYKRYEAVLTATAGQVASVNCRPLAAETEGHSGFPIGGEVTISGTADGDGLVGSDGFPFLSAFPMYGFEVVSISGTGASVTHRVAE